MCKNGPKIRLQSNGKTTLATSKAVSYSILYLHICVYLYLRICVFVFVLLRTMTAAPVVDAQTCCWMEAPKWPGGQGWGYLNQEGDQIPIQIQYMHTYKY